MFLLTQWHMKYITGVLKTFLLIEYNYSTELLLHIHLYLSILCYCRYRMNEYLSKYPNIIIYILYNFEFTKTKMYYKGQIEAQLNRFSPNPPQSHCKYKYTINTYKKSKYKYSYKTGLLHATHNNKKWIGSAVSNPLTYALIYINQMIFILTLILPLNLLINKELDISFN